MSLKRRVVGQISKYLDPGEIFELITRKNYPYTTPFREKYICRDRALMSMAFSSAGRISPIIGGLRYSTSQPKKMDEEGNFFCVMCGKMLKRTQVKYCSKECRSLSSRKFRVVGRYRGLTRENLLVENDRIFVDGMEVGKRTQKVIDKYGDRVKTRERFMIPLERDMFENPYWDQLVPFGWLIKKYLDDHAPKRGRLFRVSRWRAWKIIKTVTGQYPNWFRSQSENFYGHFIYPDSVKLAQFIKVVKPETTAHYIGYSWAEQLKDKEAALDFSWIERAVSQIRES